MRGTVLGSLRHGAEERRGEPQAEGWGTADRHRLLVCHNCDEPEATASCFDEGGGREGTSTVPTLTMSLLPVSPHWWLTPMARLPGRRRGHRGDKKRDGGGKGEASMSPPTGPYLLRAPSPLNTTSILEIGFPAHDPLKRRP